MKKLLVFVNFIEASEKALNQAISLGKKDGAVIVICHILDPNGSEDDAKEKLQPYIDRVKAAGLNTELEIERGSVFEGASKAARRIKPDLVIAGTRGAEGFDMSIFGSAIYKFVREVAFTSLVIHSDSKVSDSGYRNIMLPVSPHPNFLKKVSETLKVLDKDGEVVVFALVKEGIELDDDIAKNIEQTKEYLEKLGVKWQYREFVIKKSDHNFAEKTLERVEELGTDLIAISADVSAKNQHFGKMHKEDVLLNKHSMPILCVNTDMLD